MSIPVSCRHCGFFFLSNIFGVDGKGSLRASFSNVGTSCPKCGGTAFLDGEFQISKGQTVVISAPWLKDFEHMVRQLRITKDQARRIQRKIVKTANIKALPKSVRKISPEIAGAVEQVINENTSETDKWQWLYRIAAVVGIVAGVNTFSSDYNIDSAIKWVKSHLSENTNTPSADIPDQESVEKTFDDDQSGPR